MGSFKRALLGYRRIDVDAAIAARDTQISHLEGQLPKITELERELTSVSGMVLERERQVNDLREELRAANDRHERSLASLESLSERLEEIQAQARGQATRIRMKALREAVEVSRRVQELATRVGIDPATLSLEAAANGNGHGEIEPKELFEGLVKVDIGPLGDFSQLLGFEDAAGQIEATREISIEKFSEGRATLAVRLDEPVDLLKELEQRSPLGFKVRQTAADRLVLDVESEAQEQGPEQQAA
jgi:chromosome segregation ATPase